MSAVNPIASVNAAQETRHSSEASLAAAKLRSGAPADKASEAAKEFESVFLSQLFGMMFSGIKTDGFFGGGTGEKMWRGFLLDHIADAYAERGGIGIADSVMAQIVQMSEHDK
ncbi:rod-binding protein [Hyphococcus sp.]|jgi:Rod binding domain-containing protein|uniref:rod-binding protein n=1 Tax=Hyphococcus sp. TaxID=2038636 RepID=UPI003D1242FF